MKKQLIAVLTGLALAIGASGSAHAAPTAFSDGDAITLNNWSWEFHGALSEIEIDGDPYMGDTLDEGDFSVWDDENVSFDNMSSECDLVGGDASFDTDATTGDIVLTCDSLVGGNGDILTLEASLRVFGGEFEGRLGRVTYIVRNTSNGPVSYSWQLRHEFGECDNGIGATGGDNDGTLEVADFWAACNSDGSSEAPIALAWGSLDGIDKAKLLDGTMVDDNISLISNFADGPQVSLSASDVRAYSFYYLVDDFDSTNPEYASLNAEFTELAACLFDDGVGPRLRAGLGDIPDNWGYRDTDRDCLPAALAETGADVNSLVGFAAFAMIAGIALVAVRRRAYES